MTSLPFLSQQGRQGQENHTENPKKLVQFIKLSRCLQQLARGVRTNYSFFLLSTTTTSNFPQLLWVPGRRNTLHLFWEDEEPLVLSPSPKASVVFLSRKCTAIKSLTHLHSAVSVATHFFSLVPPSQDQPLSPKGSLRFQCSVLLTCSHPTSAATAWGGCTQLCKVKLPENQDPLDCHPESQIPWAVWKPGVNQPHGLGCGTGGNSPHQPVTSQTQQLVVTKIVLNNLKDC